MPVGWDIEKLRADTAGCAQTIFFNNAGASLQPRPVVGRVIEHLRLEEQIGGYEAADRVTGGLEALYDSVARLLNCAADEIALQENATRGWEMAFYSLRFAAGDRIVTTANDMPATTSRFCRSPSVPGQRFKWSKVTRLERWTWRHCASCWTTGSS